MAPRTVILGSVLLAMAIPATRLVQEAADGFFFVWNMLPIAIATVPWLALDIGMRRAVTYANFGLSFGANALTWFAYETHVGGGSSTDSLVLIFIPIWAAVAGLICGALAGLAGWAMSRTMGDE